MTQPAGNPNWPGWYPGVVGDYSTEVYGQPNVETLRIITASLEPASDLLDAAGGYGRFAIPLARAGLNVTIADVDQPHLDAASRRAAELPGGSGTVTTLRADLTKPVPELEDKEFDGLLIAGFIYLAPEAIARSIFKNAVSYTDENGLVVVEFATNPQRNTIQPDGEIGESLMGECETQYSRTEGEELVRSMFADEGVIDIELSEKVIDLKGSYYFHNDLLIVSGRRTA